MRFPPVHTTSGTHISPLLPLSPSQGFLNPPTQCHPQRHRAGSWLCLLPSVIIPWKSLHFPMQCAFPGGSGCPSPILSCILPSVSQAPLPSEAQPSPHCLNLKPQLSCLDFVAIHSNLSSSKSLDLQQLPPEGGQVQFLCRYLCPSRSFQELQLSLTSVQCSTKWAVYGNKLKMFTILYILYI